MALTGLITQNVPTNFQEIVFSDGSPLDSITYSAGSFTYPITALFTLSKIDFLVFIRYKTQYYNALLQNFPLLIQSTNIELPIFRVGVISTTSPNAVQFNQFSAGQPVYRISYDRDTHDATFTARAGAISITPEEFLFAFPLLTQFANQVALA